MAVRINQSQPLFPDVPRESPAITKDGDFTELWSLGLGALFQALQENYTNEGIIFPSLSLVNMNNIAALYSSFIGQTYNSLTQSLPDISGKTVFCRDTYSTNQFVIAQDSLGLVILAKWVPFGVMLTNSGTPVNAVAGIVSWQCFDINAKILYICTVAGNAANAVWQAV